MVTALLEYIDLFLWPVVEPAYYYNFLLYYISKRQIKLIFSFLIVDGQILVYYAFIMLKDSLLCWHYAQCFTLRTYYAKNYAGIMGAGLH